MRIFTYIVTALALMLPLNLAHADEHVQGYTRNDGTVVQPYERSSPDGTVMNNHSYEGNTNPNTGSVGTNRYEHDTTSPYYNGTPDSNGRTGHAGGGY
jgi:hypothetical protein